MVAVYYVCVFFFFFQAEDGIRDLTVTGVQTCALPIFRSEGADPVSEPAFHLTPLDVRKQEFRRRLRGYEPLGVEDFRARVADELERILREKAVLDERLAALGEQLRVYRERERAMNEALVAAQQLREETRAGAAREAQVIVREAQAEAH